MHRARVYLRSLAAFTANTLTVAHRVLNVLSGNSSHSPPVKLIFFRPDKIIPTMILPQDVETFTFLHLQNYWCHVVKVFFGLCIELVPLLHVLCTFPWRYSCVG